MPTNNIRQRVLDEVVVAQLATILKVNGYAEDLGRKVYDYNDLAQMVGDDREKIAKLPTPFSFYLDSDEDPDEEKGGWGRYERVLALTTGFVIAYSGETPTRRARACLSDLQLALGSAPFRITVPLESGGTGTTTVELTEVGNSFNGGPVKKGLLYGQVDWRLEYRTSRKDPTKH